MEDKRIIYGGSKAIKVTSDMQKGLNSYVKITQDYDSSSLELNNLEKTISEKNNELQDLKAKETSEDNKESKQINKIEKELEKLENDANRTRVNVQELETNKNKPQLEGTTFKTYAALENNIIKASVNEQATETPVNEEIISNENNPEIPIVNETTNIQQAPENEPLVMAQELPNIPDENINTPVTDSVIPEVPIIDSNIESATINETEKPSEKESILPDTEETPSEATFENIFDTEINEEPIISEDNDGVDTSNDQKSETENVIPESKDKVPEMDEEKSILDELNEEIEEPESAEEIPSETNKDNLISELEEDIDEKDSEQEIAEDNRENDDEFNFDTLTNDDLDRIWNELHEDKSGINSPNIEKFDENDKFNPLVTELTSFKENTDISNLTQFNEYNDYVFAYGQKTYGKEALTPKEIDTLGNNEDFLDEKNFLKQRNSQYHDIARENERIKQEITALGEEYQKNIDSMSEKYTKNVNELNETLEEAKKEINKLLTQKTQYERLNNTLSETANEQSQKIEELTNANKGLQDTIVNQSGKIANLEKSSEEQAQKMTELEGKLNKVFGIVKDEIDE